MTAQPRWLDESELEDWMQIRRLLTALPARLARDLAPTALSATDYEVLSTLSERADHAWGLRDLAAKMEWSRSRLSHHAARMESRGLITRTPDPADARGSIYHLTERGLSTLREAAPTHVESVRERFLDHLSREELAVLGGISRRIADLPD
ncbi:MarR family winged helix-turn-helix transcriptional regulator [Propionibacteriaceae bacterium G1746]